MLFDAFKEVSMCVFVEKKYYEAFCDVLTNNVKHYKADRLKINEDTLFAMKMSQRRYSILVDKCAEADIQLATYSKTKILHKIVK